MTQPDLSEFDEIGIKPAASAETAKGSGETKSTPQISGEGSSAKNNPQQPAESPPQKNSASPKKVVFGCLIFFFALFAILIAAMIFGLRAGEETISSFGLSPATFKNWTIGMVSVLFGSLALATVISIVYHLGQRILTSKDNLIEKAKAGMKGLVSGIIFVVLLSLC